MKYKKIVIENYKGITSPIEIDFTKNTLFPIIGVNECGKTTILNAIFSFDSYNDDYDDTIHHLTDVNNLYATENNPARITAIIDTNKEELKELISDYYSNNKETFGDKKFKYTRHSKEINEIKITRILENNKKYYETEIALLPKDITDIHGFCTQIMTELPYILYFDDFKDSFPDKIEIKKDTTQPWFSIIEQLFLQTNPKYNVSDLPKLENRQRKSILGDVQKHLNQSLTKEWANFRLEEKEPLEIAIEYFTEEETIKKESVLKPVGTVATTIPENINVTKNFLKFEVIDKDPAGNKRYFYVRDRSKGFYWFFNFVMKLEFNPKINGSENNAIYLLDEPGSYLHSFAQTKLCKKLKGLSEKHKVLYCTHSHYLLNPEIIPLNKIHIANKSDYGNIQLTKYHNFNSSENKLPSAFQPIYDALQLQPRPFELANKKTLLVEGIYDFYSFSLFKKTNEINIMPCKGADSISTFISMMIGFKIEYIALWDNDEEGLKAKQLCFEYFGEEEAKNHFFNLPIEKGQPKIIVQNLFNGDDIVLFKKELGLNPNTSFEKTIAALYFSNKKNTILGKIGKQTIEAFNRTFLHIGI